MVLAIPAEGQERRGDGARTQLSPGAGSTSSATASVAPGGGSTGSSSSASSGDRSGGHHSGYHSGYYGHSGYRHGGHYRGYSYSYRPYFYLGYGYPYSYGHYGYYGYYHGPYRYGHYYGSDKWGSLDLDIRPEKAAIYINGQYIGVADNYDGFPEYLWLKEGTYNLVVYHEGYRTLTRKVTVLPGIELDFRDRLEPGEGTPPTELAEWMVEPPEALAEDRERSEDEEAWRDRARRYLSQRDAPEAPEAAPERDRDTLDARGEPGRLVLNLQPGDASVYLDGRFLGTADELSRLHAGLLVDPGEHTLEVVHPSFRTERRTLEVAAGDEVEVGFQLAGQ
jgi:hypothetical protein